jgi:hypothetical protein
LPACAKDDLLDRALAKLAQSLPTDRDDATRMLSRIPHEHTGVVTKRELRSGLHNMWIKLGVAELDALFSSLERRALETDAPPPPSSANGESTIRLADLCTALPIHKRRRSSSQSRYMGASPSDAEDGAGNTGVQRVDQAQEHRPQPNNGRERGAVSEPEMAVHQRTAVSSTIAHSNPKLIVARAPRTQAAATAPSRVPRVDDARTHPKPSVAATSSVALPTAGAADRAAAAEPFGPRQAARCLAESPSASVRSVAPGPRWRALASQMLRTGLED